MSISSQTPIGKVSSPTAKQIRRLVRSARKVYVESRIGVVRVSKQKALKCLSYSIPSDLYATVADGVVVIWNQ